MNQMFYGVKMYCNYYQAGVLKEKTWFVVALFRNEDHIAFERTLEGNSDILEFFVPTDQERSFLAIMQTLKAQGYVFWFEQKPNRMQEQLAAS